MLEQLLNQFNLYVWAKDKSSRYLYVNENYARAAGMDSPCQMIGKTDDEMPWRDLADEFKCGDHDVLNGMSRLNSAEKTSTVTGVTDILVSEMRFLDRDGEVIGVKGSFVDITGNRLVKQPGFYDAVNQRYYLCVPELGDIYFTVREMEVFRGILQGLTAAQIGKHLKLSSKTIETYIIYIKRKFGVATKQEVFAISMRYGLSHMI